MGNRSRQSEMRTLSLAPARPYASGAFQAAVQAEIDAIPVVLRGLRAEILQHCGEPDLQA